MAGVWAKGASKKVGTPYLFLQPLKLATEKLAGLPWVWEFPWGFLWVWVWDGYGDYDESPWVCGDSKGIFEWIPNYVKTS